jgi:hypothetical protein
METQVWVRLTFSAARVATAISVTTIRNTNSARAPSLAAAWAVMARRTASQRELAVLSTTSTTCTRSMDSVTHNADSTYLWGWQNMP